MYDALTTSKGSLGTLNTQSEVLASSITLKIFLNVTIFSQMLKGVLVTYKILLFPKLLGFPNLLPFYVTISDKCEELRITSRQPLDVLFFIEDWVFCILWRSQTRDHSGPALLSL